MQLILIGILFLFCLGVIHGAIRDITTFTIPNYVSYGLAALFVPFAVLGLDQTAAWLHVGLGLVVLLICLVFWKLKWLGGGDVKFLAAVSLWMGPQGILLFLVLLTAISACLVLLLRFARERNSIVQASGWPAVVKQMVQKAEENAIPYGLPTAIAALAVMFGKFPGVT